MAKRSQFDQGRKPTGQQTEWVYGLHSVDSRITRAADSIIEAFVDEKRHDARMAHIIDGLNGLGIVPQAVNKRALANMIGEGNHQGVVLKCKAAEQKTEKALYALLENLNHAPLILILDQITDPHNLGACLRTADGAGVDAVVLPKDGACPINETVRRVASGAAEAVNVFYVTNLARCMKEIQQRGVWITGLSDQADQSLQAAKLSRPIACVLGAEGKGMRKLTMENCDTLVSIPMRGEASSLNVSVATGVVLYSLV
ncbi:MAG: 23S rRNA (guanosine(2251)-2'-O)-methyltransferase RlmB [Arenicellales bacterium]